MGQEEKEVGRVGKTVVQDDARISSVQLPFPLARLSMADSAWHNSRHTMDAVLSCVAIGTPELGYRNSRIKKVKAGNRRW